MLSNRFVQIRPFQVGDAPQIYEAAQESVAEVSPWLPDLVADLSIGAIDTWLDAQAADRASREGYHFAIVDTRDESFLGGCGLTQINRRHRFANLYYWVRTSRTGQGVAAAATLLVARFGFETVGLQRVEIVVAEANLASIRVAEKVGALREGRLRNRLRTDDTNHDALIFSLIPSDLTRGTGQ